jgi:ATP/maltotriose-dependent transcriptional regulator MalT
MNLSKFLPPKPAHVLNRERLTNKLLEWEDKKLVVIHAQAGQGKSTLAAGYVQSLTSPSVWYTMDQEDDNPSVFLSALGTAIQRAWPRDVPAVPSIPLNRYGINGVRQDIGTWIEQVFGNFPNPGLLHRRFVLADAAAPDETVDRSHPAACPVHDHFPGAAGTGHC